MSAGIIIGGQHGVAVWGRLRIWAERGLVRIEDARDNSFKSLSIQQAWEHIDGLNEMLRRSKQDPENINKHFKYMEDLHNHIDEVAAIIQTAREQGSPDDPSAVRDLSRRRPLSMIVPKLNHSLPL